MGFRDEHPVTPRPVPPQVVESGILDRLPAEERKRQEVRGLGAGGRGPVLCPRLGMGHTTHGGRWSWGHLLGQALG